MSERLPVIQTNLIIIVRSDMILDIWHNSCETGRMPVQNLLLEEMSIDITPMQNPGALVTVTAAIKPPGFQLFLFKRGSNYRSSALTYSAVANSVLPPPRLRVRVLNSI